MAKRRWRDLSRRSQILVLVGASIELALTATAIADLVTRPAGTVRGPRAAWFAALVVQPFGPVAYLLLGPRRPARDG